MSPTSPEWRDALALIVESRRAQGLPDTIEDPLILERAAAILRLADPAARRKKAA